MAGDKMLRITLVKSPIGYSKQQKATVRGLGLTKVNQTVEQPDIPSVRGAVNKVAHMLLVEEVN